MMGTRVEVRQQAPAVCWESIVMLAICLVDAISTMLLVGAHKIVEANPIMARCLQQGPMVFFTAKMSIVILLIATAEYYRRSNPTFVSRVLKFGIGAYLLIYVSAVLAVNCF